MLPESAEDGVNVAAVTGIESHKAEARETSEREQTEPAQDRTANSLGFLKENLHGSIVASREKFFARLELLNTHGAEPESQPSPDEETPVDTSVPRRFGFINKIIPDRFRKRVADETKEAADDVTDPLLSYASVDTARPSESDPAVKLVKETIEEIDGEFSGMRERLLRDKELQATFVSLFIDQNVKPAIDTIKESGTISDEDAEQYTSIIMEQMAENIQPLIGDQPSEWKERNNQLMTIRSKVTDTDTNIRLRNLVVDLDIPPRGVYGRDPFFENVLSTMVSLQEQSALKNFAAEIADKEIPDEQKRQILEVINVTLSGDESDNLLESTSDFMRWHVLKNSAELHALFDETEFRKIENKAIHANVESIVTNTDREQKYPLAMALMNIKTAESAPYAILNAWREKGYNGDYPFLSSEYKEGHPVVKYILELPDTEIARLGDQKIPGLSGAIQLIKDNPDTFLDTTVVSSVIGPHFEEFVEEYANVFGKTSDEAAEEIRRGGYRIHGSSPETTVDYLLRKRPDLRPEDVIQTQEIANPLLSQLNRNLIQTTSYMLQEGDTQQQLFAIGVFGSNHLFVDREGRAALQSFLQTTHDSEVQVQAIAMLSGKAGDPELMEMLLQSYPHLEADAQAEIQGNIRKYVSDILEEKSALAPKSIEIVSTLLERDNADIRKVVDLLASNSDLRLDFDIKRIDDYIKIVNEPDTLDTITELKKYGFSLRSENFEVLDQVVENREVIVAKIKEIQEVFPDFSYMIAMDRHTGGKARFIIDPYDVFFHHSPDIVTEFARVQKRSGVIRQEFSNAFLRASWDKSTPVASITEEQYADLYNNISFLSEEKLGTLSPEDDRKLGGVALHMRPEVTTKLLLQTVLKKMDESINILADADEITVNEDNWHPLLLEYIQAEEDPSILNEQIRDIFAENQAKDFCLDKVKGLWLSFLNGESTDGLPYSLQTISAVIERTGGAGPLGQLDSLQKFTRKVGQAVVNPDVPDATKQKIISGLRATELRFTNERWSNESRTDFYDISGDIVAADPELFSEYFDIFEQLSPAEMKRFAKEIYPFYRAQLVLLEKPNQPHRPEDIAAVRSDIKNFSKRLRDEYTEELFDDQMSKLSGKTKELFQERFGIIKLPEQFTAEHIRSLNNSTLYLANMHGRTPTRENILGFYLALKMNGQWDAFRKGETIEASEYLTAEKSGEIATLLKRRETLSPITPENLGLEAKDMPEFLRLLQQETQNVVTGNIETIDVKLANIILNLRTITDMDLYPEPMDRKRMELLTTWGNKKVGSVVARMYQQAAKPDKQFAFKDDDEQIRNQVLQIMQSEGIDHSDPQLIKEHFQDGMRPLATGVNLLTFIDQSGAEAEIGTLQTQLIPSPDVVGIFKRLGEDFKPTSGALALSQDLTYLDTLIVKREDELQAGEKELLTEYIASIREQVGKLEDIYTKISDKFKAMRQGSQNTHNQFLEAKFEDIDRVMKSQNSEQIITSTMTEDLDIIIENMRECLSCTKNGANNYTNLTYGDSNKFYMYSSSEHQRKGSISDQVVFLDPVTREDGQTEMSFVFDRIYGTNTPTILRNQVETVLKKVRVLKDKFPDAKLSLFVTRAALTTGGSAVPTFVADFNDKDMQAAYEKVTVDVTPSAFADHYVEFGGDVRRSGKREVEGVTITI